MDKLKHNYKNKTPQTKSKGRKKRFAKTKDDTIVEIPPIVDVRPIAVQPPVAIRVALDVEHVRITIGVS